MFNTPKDDALRVNKCTRAAIGPGCEGWGGGQELRGQWQRRGSTHWVLDFLPSADTQVPWHHVQGGLAEAGDDGTLPLDRHNRAPHLLRDLGMVDLPDRAGYQSMEENSAEKNIAVRGQVSEHNNTTEQRLLQNLMLLSWGINVDNVASNLNHLQSMELKTNNGTVKSGDLIPLLVPSALGEFSCWCVQWKCVKRPR